MKKKEETILDNPTPHRPAQAPSITSSSSRGWEESHFEMKVRLLPWARLKIWYPKLLRKFIDAPDRSKKGELGVNHERNGGRDRS